MRRRRDPEIIRAIRAFDVTVEKFDATLNENVLALREVRATFERYAVSHERVLAKLDDHSDEHRAHTEALMRLIDRIDRTDDGGARPKDR